MLDSAHVMKLGGDTIPALKTTLPLVFAAVPTQNDDMPGFVASGSCKKRASPKRIALGVLDPKLIKIIKIRGGYIFKNNPTPKAFPGSRERDRSCCLHYARPSC